MNLFPDFLSASLVLISIFSWLFSVSRLSFSFLPQFLPFSLSLARSLFQVGPLRAVSAASDMFSFHSGNFSSPWWVSQALHEAAPSSQWLTQDALFGNGRSIFLVKYNSTEDSAQSWCYCWSVGRGCSSSGFPGLGWTEGGRSDFSSVSEKVSATRWNEGLLSPCPPYPTVSSCLWDTERRKKGEADGHGSKKMQYGRHWITLRKWKLVTEGSFCRKEMTRCTFKPPTGVSIRQLWAMCGPGWPWIQPSTKS